MTYLDRLLAWRYLRGARSQKSISVMAIICFIGIFIGTVALTLIVSVMNGFEKITTQKLQNIHAPILMGAYGKQLQVKTIGTILDTEFASTVSWAPRTTNHVLIREQDGDVSTVALLKGVDPRKESEVSSLATTLIDPLPSGTATFINLLSTQASDTDNVLIGTKLAQQLGVTVGDTMQLLYPPEDTEGIPLMLESADVTVAGIIKTGIEEFDAYLIICSLATAQKLFPMTGVTQIAIRQRNSQDEKQLITKLSERFSTMEVYSWSSLYPALVSALKLEKYAMFFILALISLVASMNMISLLFMYLVNKRGDIAILKAHGLSDTHIRYIFMSMGLILSGAATLAGLAVAYVIGLIIQAYPCIELPDVYYMSHLPIVLEGSIFGMVFVLSLCLSMIAILIPLRMIKRITIAQVLRHEA